MRRFKFYLASGLENAAAVKEINDILTAIGGVCSYDWTTHGSVQEQGPQVFREVAQAEMDGVIAADIVVAILPGARGTHVEIGAAIAAGKPMVVYAAKDDLLKNKEGRDCVFYWHPAVTRVNTLALLLAQINNNFGQGLY